MRSYEALCHAYDTLMRDVNYDEWAEYVAGFLIESGAKKIAETACGTGNITLRLARMGFDVTASDVSAGMLECAKLKARAAGSRCMFVLQDMTKLELPRRDALICCCDGVNYLKNESELSAFFCGARACLRKGGVLLFDMSTQHKLNHTLADNFFYDDGDDATCFWQSSRIGESHVELSVSVFVKEQDGKGGAYRRYDEVQEQFAYSADRVLELLDLSGFTDCKAYSFLTRENAVREDERVQFCAKKK